MWKAASRLARQIGPELDDQAIEECLSKFPPKKRELYREGLATLLDLQKHSRITSFIKQENVPYKEKDKPRIIQFRSAVFLAHCLPFLKPLEHAYYHGRYLWNKYQKFTCAKGMDPLKRMEVITQMVQEISDGGGAHFVGLDGSAFDAHVSSEALKSEWWFNCKVLELAGYSQETVAKARRMGKAQLKNKCFARVDDGTVKYKVKGNRMSGDLNTGYGNTFLQESYLASSMAFLKIPEARWRMLVDGDDAVLIVGVEHKHKLSRLPEIFARFSQDLKVEGSSDVDVDNMECIDFCQARPVRVSGQWRLIRNPMKVYNGYNAVNIYYRTLEDSQRFWATVAQPEMIYASGVPILESLFRMFHRLSRDARPFDAVARRFWLRAVRRCRNKVQYAEGIDFETRASFEKAFGWSFVDQMSIEAELDSWELKDLPPSPSEHHHSRLAGEFTEVPSD